MYKISHFLNDQNHDRVLRTLPLSGDKTRMGKTRKEIALDTGLTPKKVTSSLQVLKNRKKVRSFHGKWRQTKTRYDI